MTTEELIGLLFSKAWKNRPETIEYKQVSNQISAAERAIREQFPACFPELDALTTAYNARNSCYARWLYRRAFSDCLSLLRTARALKRRGLHKSGADMRR